jgi:hypothetical protein
LRHDRLPLEPPRGAVISRSSFTALNGASASAAQNQEDAFLNEGARRRQRPDQARTVVKISLRPASRGAKQRIVVG